MAGAPPPLPSSRPKGAYVPPPVPFNRPKVAYVHPLPPSTPVTSQEDVHMKPGQQSAVISMDERDAAPNSLGQQLQAALQNRMMNNLNDISSKPKPPNKPSGVEAPRPVPSQRPDLSHKTAPQTNPIPRNRPMSYSSFGDLFGGSTNKQQQQQQQSASLSNQTSHTSSSSSSSSFNQLSGLFGSTSSSSSSTGSNVTLTATSEQKKAAANFSWNVAKDTSKNVSAKDAFSVGSLFASSYANKGKVNASQDQQAALGRISGQVGQSAAKNVTAEEIGHATNFATTNAVNNATRKAEPGSQQKSSIDLIAQMMGSKGGVPPQSQNPAARARPKPLQQNAPAQLNLASGLPPPPSPTPRQKVAPQSQRVAPQPQRVAPQPQSSHRSAPRAPPSKTKPQGGGGSLIDFDASDHLKSGPPGLPKSKAQGGAGGRSKPTIIRPNAGNSRSSSPAVEQQQKKSKPPPRPVGGPPTKKMAPARPNAVHGTRSAGSTPPRPSGLQPKRKAPPRPGSQKGKKMAPKGPGGGGGAAKKLPPRPGPGHALYNKYMGSEPHAVATFDYQGVEADELSFKTDDVIILVKRIDADWLVGKCKNKEGMFPVQFVKVVKDLNEIMEEDYDGPQAVAIYGFIASAADEIGFEEGDTIKLLGTVGTVWFRGEVKGKSGIFPSNHVEVIVPLPGGSPSIDSISSGPRCKAKFEYTGSSADDLTFSEGAIIKLTGRVGDEWYNGELNGQSGIFPAAFIDVIEDLPAAVRASPTTGNEVRALFDFDGADNTELTFKDGDKITVTAQVGTDWLEGELNGKKGRFPAAFADRIPSGLPQATDRETSGVDPHCVVSFDFEPAGEDEIKLKAGEKVTLLERIGEDWLRGKVDSREGIFPRSFVDVIIDLPSAGATPSTAKALHDFDAEDADELNFKADDVITITERVNDEWLMGTVNGKSGRFPAAFVELSS
ncbi:SH3 domain-containing protein 19 isoform X1 [Strongylocentrotus purpuratus]|uniref:SH3 domain-containing protein n=1 Tax=Strongylocentrotus purpuratus TaxID=7668 RepID=A0A7M7RGE8_STRPU|nr:SH3 domain-containing protein 19 isoform X1 [Strongylocentrotus purpuratus]